MEGSLQKTLKRIRASGCSKVLVTGAYLIIEPKYSGVVLATDAKFYCDTSKTKNQTNEESKID